MIATTPPPAYVVQAGDTLWDIAGDLLGSPYKWPALWSANRADVPDPNRIYPGQRLVISPLTWRPLRDTTSDPDDSSPAAVTASAPSSGYGGTLGCAALESLWVRAGGPSWAATVAASVAMAESAGQQYATGPAGERGYWQISPDHGPLSTYDPLGNARAAVAISSGGRDWSAWTTYTDGAYLGRC